MPYYLEVGHRGEPIKVEGIFESEAEAKKLENEYRTGAPSGQTTGVRYVSQEEIDSGNRFVGQQTGFNTSRADIGRPIPLSQVVVDEQTRQNVRLDESSQYKRQQSGKINVEVSASSTAGDLLKQLPPEYRTPENLRGLAESSLDLRREKSVEYKKQENIKLYSEALNYSPANFSPVSSTTPLKKDFSQADFSKENFAVKASFTPQEYAGRLIQQGKLKGVSYVPKEQLPKKDIGGYTFFEQPPRIVIDERLPDISKERAQAIGQPYFTRNSVLAHELIHATNFSMTEEDVIKKQKELQDKGLGFEENIAPVYSRSVGDKKGFYYNIDDLGGVSPTKLVVPPSNVNVRRNIKKENLLTANIIGVDRFYKGLEKQQKETQDIFSQPAIYQEEKKIEQVPYSPDIGYTPAVGYTPAALQEVTTLVPVSARAKKIEQLKGERAPEGTIQRGFQERKISFIQQPTKEIAKVGVGIAAFAIFPATAGVVGTVALAYGFAKAPSKKEFIGGALPDIALYGAGTKAARLTGIKRSSLDINIAKRFTEPIKPQLQEVKDIGKFIIETPRKVYRENILNKIYKDYTDKGFIFEPQKVVGVKSAMVQDVSGQRTEGLLAFDVKRGKIDVLTTQKQKIEIIGRLKSQEPLTQYNLYGQPMSKERLRFEQYSPERRLVDTFETSTGEIRPVYGEEEFKLFESPYSSALRRVPQTQLSKDVVYETYTEPRTTIPKKYQVGENIFKLEGYGRRDISKSLPEFGIGSPLKPKTIKKLERIQKPLPDEETRLGKGVTSFMTSFQPPKSISGGYIPSWMQYGAKAVPKVDLDFVPSIEAVNEPANIFGDITGSYGYNIPKPKGRTTFSRVPETRVSSSRITSSEPLFTPLAPPSISQLPYSRTQLSQIQGETSFFGTPDVTPAKSKSRTRQFQLEGQKPLQEVIPRPKQDSGFFPIQSPIQEIMPRQEQKPLQEVFPRLDIPSETPPPFLRTPKQPEFTPPPPTTSGFFYPPPRRGSPFGFSRLPAKSRQRKGYTSSLIAEEFGITTKQAYSKLAKKTFSGLEIRGVLAPPTKRRKVKRR